MGLPSLLVLPSLSILTLVRLAIPESFSMTIPSLPTAPVRANLIERMMIEIIVNKVMVIRI